MHYEDIFRRLNEREVDYVVVGGVALVLHGVIRLTADLDLMVHLEEKNLTRFIETMEELGYRPKVPAPARSLLDPQMRQRFVEEKNMKVFSFYHPQEAVSLVDIFIDEPADYGTIKAHSVKIRSGSTIIPIVSIDDLITLKRISGRPQDLADIAALEEVKKR